MLLLENHDDDDNSTALARNDMLDEADAADDGDAAPDLRPDHHDRPPGPPERQQRLLQEGRQARERERVRLRSGGREASASAWQAEWA